MAKKAEPKKEDKKPQTTDLSKLNRDDLSLALLAQFNKQFGKDNPIMCESQVKLMDVKVMSMECIDFDYALGGGFAEGRIVEIYGPESSGKSTLAQLAIAFAQIKYPNKLSAYVDSENALDSQHMKELGVNMNYVHVTQPDATEDAVDIIESLALSGFYSVIVYDSIAASAPRQELEGDSGDSNMGVQARLASQAFRKLKGVLNKTGTILIVINQSRFKIGVMFGNPETTTSGEALKYYATHRIRTSLTKDSFMKDEDGNLIGVRINADVRKNKIAPPFRKAIIPVLFKHGIDKASEVLLKGTELEIIKKSGSWYSYGDVKIAQGEEAAINMFRDNPELVDEIKTLIINKLYKK